MKCYTVAPNRDANGWRIKLEDTATASEYAKNDDAMQADLEFAQANSRSLLVAQVNLLEVEDE